MSVRTCPGWVSAQRERQQPQFSNQPMLVQTSLPGFNPSPAHLPPLPQGTDFNFGFSTSHSLSECSQADGCPKAMDFMEPCCRHTAACADREKVATGRTDYEQGEAHEQVLPITDHSGYANSTTVRHTAMRMANITKQTQKTESNKCWSGCGETGNPVQC